MLFNPQSFCAPAIQNLPEVLLSVSQTPVKLHSTSVQQISSTASPCAGSELTRVPARETPLGAQAWPVPQPASGHRGGHRCLRGASSAGCQSTAQPLGKATGERCLLLRGPADSWLPRELMGFLSSERPRSGKLTGIPTSGSNARHCPSVRSFPLTATCDSRTSGFSASIKVQRFLLCSILLCALALQTDALTAGTQH